jgi:hypothetical protein
LDFVSAKAVSGGSVNKFTSASVNPSLTALICTIDCAGATTDSDPSSTVTTTLNTHFSIYGKIIQRLDGDMNLLFAKNVKKDYNASFTNGTDNFSNVKDTIIKYDNAGNVIWKYKTTNAMPVSIIHTLSGDLYVSGFNLSNANCDPMTNDPNGLLGISDGYLFKWNLATATDLEYLESEDQESEIYPNPASSHIQLTASSKLGLVSIADVLGKIVYEKNTPEKDLMINISFLQNGIYFITVNGSIKKIIKE